MPNPPSDDESGMLVYPKLPVPKQRVSDPGMRPSRPPGPRRKLAIDRRALVGLVGAAVVGGAIGFAVRPTHAGDLAKARAALADAQKVSAADRAHADEVGAQLEAAKQAEQQAEAAQKDAEQKAADLSTKAADAEQQAQKLAADQKKLQAAVDKGTGSVDTEGTEIHLKLVDRVLFPVGEDQLTPKGKAVLAKVAAALRDIPDKQVWVQGHTDDQPIYVHPPKKDGKDKGKDAKTKDAPQPIRFITNWELSAARALQVVHYLQDVGKIDPTRLAAVAFGQYRPISRTNKALNRRIEIVLYPKREILKR